MKIAMRIKNIFFKNIVKINEPLYSIIISIYNGFWLIKDGEKVHWSKKDSSKFSSKEKFLIISFSSQEMGFASYYDKVLGYYLYAKKRNYIPVIDFSDSANSIYDCERGGNPWEYYYEQKYSLEQAYAGDYIMANPRLITLYKRINKKNIAKRNSVSAQIYYNASMKDYIERKEKKMKVKNYTCGVYYRGTDYRTAIGHAKIMGYEEFFNSLKIFLEERKCRDIFLVTEEAEAVEFFQLAADKCGINILYFNHPRYEKYEQSISIPNCTPDGLTVFERDRDYILDIDMLSKCDFLFGPKTSGIMMALNMNGNKYKAIHITDI